MKKGEKATYIVFKDNVQMTYPMMKSAAMQHVEHYKQQGATGLRITSGRVDRCGKKLKVNIDDYTSVPMTATLNWTDIDTGQKGSTMVDFDIKFCPQRFGDTPGTSGRIGRQKCSNPLCENEHEGEDGMMPLSQFLRPIGVGICPTENGKAVQALRFAYGHYCHACQAPDDIVLRAEVGVSKGGTNKGKRCARILTVVRVDIGRPVWVMSKQKNKPGYLWRQTHSTYLGLRTNTGTLYGAIHGKGAIHFLDNPPRPRGENLEGRPYNNVAVEDWSNNVPQQRLGLKGL
jgi:hypothetical protein